MKMKRRSVLVAESDRALSRVLRMALERAGFTVYAAFDEEQAGILAARQRYDMIITDFDSITLNAVEFCRYVREELGLAEVPIAACCSGGASDEVTSLVYKYGISKLFFKPVDPDLVIEFANESVGSRLVTV